MDQDALQNAHAIAIEHCLWAVEQGLSPVELLAALGDELTEFDAVNWQTVIDVIVRVWRML